MPMVRSLAAALLLLGLPLLLANQPEPRVERRTISSGGTQRQYYFFAPPGACRQGAEPVPALAPALVLHHGTGGDGSEMVSAWLPLARSERIVLVAPTGTGRYGWQAPGDGPDLERDIVKALRRECALDPRRLYVFGYSAGGDFALFSAASQSEYYAAAAVHAAALRPRQFAMLDRMPRKLPVAYSIGTRDPVYSLAEARATRDAFQTRRFPLLYTEMEGHGHDYSPVLVNRRAWEFLSRHRLAADPKYTPLDDAWLGFALK